MTDTITLRKHLIADSKNFLAPTPKEGSLDYALSKKGAK